MEELYNSLRKEYPQPKINFKPFYPDKPKFFEFLFKHFFKINRWNKRFDLLKILLFSKKRIEIKSNFKKKLEEIYNKYFLTLKLFLKEIIDKGWRYDFLSIKEYNLIVIFMDMAIKLENIISYIKLNDLYFLGFEESFMRIHKNRDYFSILFEALKKIYNHIEKNPLKTSKKEKKDEDNKDELLKSIENIYYLFHTGYVYPSLFDLIFAFNIYQTERFLDYDNLFKQDVIPTIQSGFYDCAKEIFEEILRQLNNLLNEEERLNKERERIEWLKSICEIDNNQKIFSFYNKTFKSWDNDKEDVFYLFLNITKVIIEKLDFLFFKEWEVTDSADRISKIKIIDPTELEPIHQKIYNDFLYLKSKYFASSINRVSIEEYKRSENFISLLSETQHQLYEKMLTILSNFKYIADKIKKINESSFYNKQNNLEKFLIYYPNEFKGNSIDEVLNYYVELLLQICFYFKENNTLSEIRKLQNIINNIEEIEERINKLSDTNNFIRESFKKIN